MIKLISEMQGGEQVQNNDRITVSNNAIDNIGAQPTINNDIIITKASIEALEVIGNIHRQSFGAEWALSDIDNTLQLSHATILVAQCAGIFCGYICYYASGDIINVAVLPDYRKCGVGSSLISSAITRAKYDGVEYLYLEVRESNTAAIMLYERTGFKQISLRRNYYSNGECALIYKYIL